MKLKKIISAVLVLIMILTLSVPCALPVLASQEVTEQTAQQTAAEADDGMAEAQVLSSKAIAAAVCIGIVGAAGAIGMGLAIAKSAESMARQPEASGKINSAMMLGLVFIETAIIYALIIAILIIFVL